jgi:hypothetical protein
MLAYAEAPLRGRLKGISGKQIKVGQQSFDFETGCSERST